MQTTGDEHSDDRKRWRIEYRDPDPDCPIFTMDVLAYDRAHAEEVFWDDDVQDEDWEIISIKEVK